MISRRKINKTYRSCKRGHICGRDLSGHCIVCNKITRIKRYEENPEPQRKRNKKWKEANRESVLEGHRRRNALEQTKESKRKWSKENPDKERKCKEVWKKENTDKVNALTAKRYTEKLYRIPSWVDLEEIQVVYKEASKLTKLIGIQYDVDHIIPLQGKLVSGLHIVNNLQVITHIENMKKGNRFEVL